ncbi:hypothetical protein [Streptomyces sp. NPDC006289]|uniref:hypothetical protein n=1 Tax=Streptomyces sp. NPDC006289 TaxID=3156744 RepID=UPI0033ABCD00
MIRTDISTGMRIGLTYKPSPLPFDTAFDRGTETGIVLKPRLMQVNSDVKLVYGADEHREARYQVYVQCKIQGTPSGQEREVPLAGELTDTLTADVSVRDHLTLLLHSARVMANTIDCQNKPVVPRALPASTTIS